jgi:hypothetical protein
MFKTIDKCPELLVYRGAIEMEQFISFLQNNVMKFLNKINLYNFWVFFLR